MSDATISDIARVTIKELAEHLGVAPSSVSRVLNDHPDVSEPMRRRVLKGVKELGYEPDYLAQSLRRGATRSVGFVLRDLSNPIFADIVKGAETRLRKDGHSLILTNSEGDAALDAKNIDILRQRRVDGMILSLQSESYMAIPDLLRKLKMPIVLIDREIPSLNVSIVRCDHFAGVHAAVTHLVELGHRRIGFISGPSDILATRERLAGLGAAFNDAGLVLDDDLVRLGSYSRQFGYEQTIQLMGLRQRPTALVCAGIQLTTGSLAALSQFGIEIGRELSLVSCDEEELLRYCCPPVSVVRRDSALIGELAAEMLLDQLLDHRPPRQATVPTEYVPRASSAPNPLRGDE